MGDAGGDRILRNSTWNLAAQGVYAIFHIAAIALLARGLGKDGLGEYYTLFALVLVAQLLLEAGIGTALTRRLAQDAAALKDTVAQASAIFTLIALASAALFVAAGALAAWWRRDPGALLDFSLAGVACAALQVQRFCAGVFRAFEQFGAENLSRVLQGASLALLLGALIVLERVALTPALLVLAVSQLLAAAYLMVALHRSLRGVGWRLSGGQLRAWLAQGVPLGLGDVLRGLTWQLDTVLLGWMRPAAEVGIYSVAYRPLGPLNWLPRAVAAASFTSFARLAESDREALGRSFAATVRVLWIASLPFVVALYVCAEPVVRLIAGSAYLEAAVPLRILIWLTCLSFISYPLGVLFAAVGRARAYARLAAAVFALEVLLELALIPWWGYFGACAGTLLGELAFTLAGFTLCYRMRIRSLEWGALARATGAAALMAAALWPARDAEIAVVLSAMAGATVLYLVLCIAFGAVGVAELKRYYRALTPRVIVETKPRKDVASETTRV